ncbi:MAG: hypothetical protein WDM91_19385 [Rhizomicrobium sp.]
MFLLMAIGAVLALCGLLWRVAVHALPVFVGFTAGWWALSLGAGAGSAVVGLAAGMASWALAGWASRSECRALRIAAAITCALPAAYVGFTIVWQITELGISNAGWRILFAVVAGLAAGLTTVARLDHATTAETP